MESKRSCSENNSQKKKRQKTCFTSNEKNMIVSVYEYVKKTWPTNEYPYKTSLNEKTAAILGIGVASVYRILKENETNEIVKSPALKKKKPNVAEKIGAYEKNAIRKKVHGFYMKGELPAFKKVLDAVNDDEELPDFKSSTFHRLLKHLKFRHIKLKGSYALIETNDIILWRLKYLRDIKTFRSQNRPVFYMNETWISEGHTVTSESDDALGTAAKNPTSKGKSLIVVHMGSENGFLDGAEDVIESNATWDYQESMDAHHFEQWFEDNLPKLGKNAVVVMDTAPYNSRRLEKTPTAAWTKGDIQEWLQNKEISFDGLNLKAELLKKVNDVRARYKTYAVDELARKHQVEVLRLPPHHCELNPIELVWADVKGYIAKHNTTSRLGDVKILLQDAIRSVSPYKWRDCINHVIKMEEYFYSKLDYMIDNTVDTFGINISDSDSDSATESCTSSTDESLLNFKL